MYSYYPAAEYKQSMYYVLYSILTMYIKLCISNGHRAMQQSKANDVATLPKVHTTG